MSDRSNTLVSSRPNSIAFSWTHTIAPEDEEQPGLELTRDLDTGLEPVYFDGNFEKEVYIPEEKEMMEKEVADGPIKEESKSTYRPGIFCWECRGGGVFG